MLLHLFRGQSRIFALVADPDSPNLPSKFGPWQIIKAVEVERGSSVPGVNAKECLDDIERFGIHVTDAHVRITEQALT